MYSSSGKRNQQTLQAEFESSVRLEGVHSWSNRNVQDQAEKHIHSPIQSMSLCLHGAESAWKYFTFVFDTLSPQDV